MSGLVNSLNNLLRGQQHLCLDERSDLSIDVAALRQAALGSCTLQIALKPTVSGNQLWWMLRVFDADGIRFADLVSSRGGLR